MKELPKLKDLKAFDKKFQLKESNAFSKSIATINPAGYLVYPRIFHDVVN